jgi:asparagine synthase (glutamine-hydrolysing)
MCAIAGLICLKQQCSEEEHLPVVRKMSDLQHHRGPDDNGVLSLGHVCLGSNRLSIIDLSKAGHMPMSDEDEEWWIVYNGEIYNFQSIREELLRCGHRFRSKTDTEVVLHAFQQWGEKCLERFVGMFAFAIFDRHTDTVTLVRDRYGKKPLYYTCRNGHILFASEMKALLRVCDDLRLNQQRLIEWSLYRNVDFGSPDTLVEEVFSLPPGHLVRIQRGQLESPRRYYAPESHVDPTLYEYLSKQPPQVLTAEIESLLQTSVKDRLISDVPLGTLCSGGIDSSLITALCARHLPDITAFHVSVPGYSDMDESYYAKQVTDRLGIKLLTYPLEGEAFRRHLPRAIYHSDVPLTHPNSIAFLLISEFARQHGVTILLSGEAADELFGGYMQRYRRYRQLLWAQRVIAYLPPKVRKTIALAGHACEAVPISAFSEYEGLLAHTIAFLDKFAREELRLRCTEAYGFIANETERAVLGAMLADVTNFLTPLLRRLDRMSMAASIECRVPFLDHRLVHTVLNLPLSYRLRGTTDKWVLKEIALHYLPRHIVYRKKVGFPLPLGDYLAPLARQELFEGGFCVEYLGMHRRGVLEVISNWRQNVHGFFNLLAVELWGRLFFLQQPLDDLTEQVMWFSDKTAVSS